MTKAERAHMNRVAALGCIACSMMDFHDSPAELHHVRTGMGMGQRASNYDVIPLCSAHHRGTAGLKVPSIHGSPDAFRKSFGTEMDLLELTTSMQYNWG